MSPNPQQHRIRKDRLSIDLVLENCVDMVPRFPHFSLIFGEGGCVEGSPVQCDDSLYDLEDAKKSYKSIETVMREIADWLDLDGRDVHWALRKWQIDNSILPPAYWNTPFPATYDSPETEQLVRFIALQLLASCYTVLPASSADNLPFYEQRRHGTLLTSLRLHSRFRWSPAAGYHARESSETSSWPGLNTEPSIEDRLAEAISRRRCRGETSQYSAPPPLMHDQSLYHGSVGLGTGASSCMQPRMTPTSHEHCYEWNDGPAELREIREQISSGSAVSSSSVSDREVLATISCQPSGSKTSRRKPHKAFFGYLPSIPTLQRTRSVPRKRSSAAAVFPNVVDARRSSSTSALPIDDSQVPEVRRISATPISPHSSPSPETSNLDLPQRPPKQDYFGKKWVSSTGSFPPGRRASSKLHPTSPSCPIEADMLSPRTGLGDYLMQATHMLQGEEREWIENCQTQRPVDSYGRARVGPTDEDDSLSEDSVDLREKRKTTVFRPVEFSPESSEKLQRKIGEDLIATEGS